MRRSKIAASIITKNEERNIKSCIDSVLGWADEIIVVDGYSEDKTAEIAGLLGAKVVEHKFDGSFATERNIGNDTAKSDWVLHLDADDRVTAEFKKNIDKVIDGDGAVDIYKFRRKSFFLGHFMEYGGWYHYIPNLVRRGRVRFEGVLHEKPVFSGKIAEVEGDIEHHPYESITQFIDRHNRYSSLEAKRIFKEKGTLEVPHLRRHIIRKSFKIFWKIYIKKKGYKEGLHGLVFAILFAFENFLIWVKYWEACIKENKK